LTCKKKKNYDFNNGSDIEGGIVVTDEVYNDEKVSEKRDKEEKRRKRE